MNSLLLLFSFICYATARTIQPQQRSKEPSVLDNLRALWSYHYNKYLSYDDIEKRIKLLQKTYPEYINLEIAGHSIENRPIYLLQISNRAKTSRRGKRMPVNLVRNPHIVDNIPEESPQVQRKSRPSSPIGYKPVIVVDGGIHAREWASPAATLYLVEQIIKTPELRDNIDWKVIPVVNPDGYSFSRSGVGRRFWRKNRNSNNALCAGVDLNRNFDIKWKDTSKDRCSIVYGGTSAFSEPESRAVRDVVLRDKGRVKAYVTVHSYGQLILYSFGYSESKLPHNLNDLHNMATGMAKSISNEYTGSKYLTGRASILGAAAGGSDDWAYEKVGVPYSFTFEMQPRGNRGLSGFNLDPSHLPQAVDEVWIAMKYLAKEIMVQFPQSTFKKTTLTEEDELIKKLIEESGFNVDIFNRPVTPSNLFKNENLDLTKDNVETIIKEETGEITMGGETIYGGETGEEKAVEPIDIIKKEIVKENLSDKNTNDNFEQSSENINKKIKKIDKKKGSETDEKTQIIDFAQEEKLKLSSNKANIDGPNEKTKPEENVNKNSQISIDSKNGSKTKDENKPNDIASDTNLKIIDKSITANNSKLESLNVNTRKQQIIKSTDTVQSKKSKEKAELSQEDHIDANKKVNARIKEKAPTPSIIANNEEVILNVNNNENKLAKDKNNIEKKSEDSTSIKKGAITASKLKPIPSLGTQNENNSKPALINKNNLKESTGSKETEATVSKLKPVQIQEESSKTNNDKATLKDKNNVENNSKDSTSSKKVENNVSKLKPEQTSLQKESSKKNNDEKSKLETDIVYEGDSVDESELDSVDITKPLDAQQRSIGDKSQRAEETFAFDSSNGAPLTVWCMKMRQSSLCS